MVQKGISKVEELWLDGLLLVDILNVGSEGAQILNLISGLVEQ